MSLALQARKKSLEATDNVTHTQLPSNVTSTSTNYETETEYYVVSASKYALHDSNEFLYDYTSSACV